MLGKKRIKTIIQLKSNECALCCVSMIASYYGFNKPIEYYRNILDGGRDGLTIQDMMEVLNSIKIKTTLANTEIEKILDLDIPVICYMKRSHFTIIEKKNDKYIYMYDPAVGKRVVSIEYFKNIFTGISIIPEKMDDFKKSSVKENIWKNYIEIIHPNIASILLLLCVSIISYLIMLFIPILIQNLIDSSEGILNINNLIKLVPMIVSLFFLISTLRNKIIIDLEKKFDILLTTSVINKLLNINLKFFEDRDDGDLMFRLNLLSIFRTTISDGFMNLFLDFTSSVIILCALFFYNFFVGIIVITSLMILGIYVKYMNSKIIVTNQEELYSQSKVYSIENELVKCIYSIKAMGIEEDIQKEFNSLYKEYIGFYSDREWNTKNNVMILTGFRMFFPILLLVLISYLNDLFNMTLGQQFAIYSMSGLLISSAISFFQNITSIFMIRNMLIRINDILNEKQVVNGSIKLNEINNISLENVAYSYNQNKNNSFELQNINININKGDTVAIVGSSGSGKSTLIKLILGLYTPTSGNIKINGENISNIDKDYLRNKIGVVPQNVILFSRSIRDNISLNNKKISFEKIQEAARISGIHDEIQEFPMKYETILSEGGGLSGGQKQRIALARAIIKDPDFIVLDEATNSLDNLNEEFINKNIKSMNCTKLIVAHRLSTIIVADYIYVLKNGRIVGEGTHEDLINRNSFYQSLFGGQIV